MDSAVLQVLSQADVPSSLLEQNAVLGTRVAAKDTVHLLEGGALGLGQGEVHPDDAGAKEDGEEDVGSPLPALEHGGNVEGDGEVVELVA